MNSRNVVSQKKIGDETVPVFSIVCVYNNANVLNNQLLEGLKDQNCKYEIILVDNTKSKYMSATQALNIGGKKARGKYIIFVHQDVYLMSKDWLLQAYNFLNDLPDFGVIGVAGYIIDVNDKFVLASNGTHGTKPVSIGIHLNQLAETLSVDECLFIIRSEIFMLHHFDEITCDDWHLYAVDYCYNQRRLNLKNYILPLSFYHYSLGQPVLSSFSRKFLGYYNTLEKILIKYAGNTQIIVASTGIWTTTQPLIFQRIRYIVIFNFAKLRTYIGNNVFYRKYIKNSKIGTLIKYLSSLH